LPREWLMAPLETARADDMKAYVREAVQWGFDQPEGLTNNARRCRWLRECRGKAWDMIAAGGDVPAPGREQPEDEKPKRARRQRSTTPPAPWVPPARPASPPPDDIFPPRRGRRRDVARKPRKVAADLCVLPARECNEWLRTLPMPDPL